MKKIIMFTILIILGAFSVTGLTSESMATPAVWQSNIADDVSTDSCDILATISKDMKTLRLSEYDYYLVIPTSSEIKVVNMTDTCNVLSSPVSEIGGILSSQVNTYENYVAYHSGNNSLHMKRFDSSGITDIFNHTFPSNYSFGREGFTCRFINGDDRCYILDNNTILHMINFTNDTAVTLTNYSFSGGIGFCNETWYGERRIVLTDFTGTGLSIEAGNIDDGMFQCDFDGNFHEGVFSFNLDTMANGSIMAFDDGLYSYSTGALSCGRMSNFKEHYITPSSQPVIVYARSSKSTANAAGCQSGILHIDSGGTIHTDHISAETFNIGLTNVPYLTNLFELKKFNVSMPCAIFAEQAGETLRCYDFRESIVSNMTVAAGLLDRYDYYVAPAIVSFNNSNVLGIGYDGNLSSQADNYDTGNQDSYAFYAPPEDLRWGTTNTNIHISLVSFRYAYIFDTIGIRYQNFNKETTDLNGVLYAHSIIAEDLDKDGFADMVHTLNDNIVRIETIGSVYTNEAPQITDVSVNTCSSTLCANYTYTFTITYTDAESNPAYHRETCNLYTALGNFSADPEFSPLDVECLTDHTGANTFRAEIQGLFSGSTVSGYTVDYTVVDDTPPNCDLPFCGTTSLDFVEDTASDEGTGGSDTFGFAELAESFQWSTLEKLLAVLLLIIIVDLAILFSGASNDGVGTPLLLAMAIIDFAIFEMGIYLGWLPKYLNAIFILLLLSFVFYSLFWKRSD